VALDRQTIARRDFPTARRGYDPAAVDAHLAAVAEEVEELSRRGPESARPGLATQTSEQVRAIVEAAEHSAAAILDAAEGEARGHVARVAQATDRLRERVDALERELNGLLSTLRAGAERVADDLEAVIAAASSAEPPAVLGLTPAQNPGVVDDELGEEPAPAAIEESPSSPPAPGALGVTVAANPGAAGDDEVGEEPALAAVEETPSEATPPALLRDVVGARIVALEMATSGHPREETDRFLAERYALPDRAALLDDVYARARA
jgi:DivIVA domain-containing protein